MRAEDLKGWLAAARRGEEEKEREAETKDGGEAGRTTVWERRTGRGW